MNLPPTAGLRADVEALAAIERGAGSDGERRSAEWIAERLAAAGAADVQLRPFRYQGTYAGAHAAHFAFGMLGGPAAVAAAVSYELEYSGRSQWLRRLLPTAEATNVVARLPAAGEARRTLVLVAHHDAARTGLIWDPRLVRLSRGGTFATTPALAFGLAVPRRTRRLGRLLLAALLALQLDVARGATVPGASDNASGVAATLALLAAWAREPLPGCEVIALFPGCEEAGMGGMAAWMREEGAALDPSRTLVLGLDTLGAGDPVVAASEGPLLPQRFREADLAWADAGAAAAGLPAPERVRVPAWTDPVLALQAGLPAISLLSMRDGLFTEYHLPTDTPDRVDWGSVERCLTIAAATGAAWAAGSSPAG
ncbi:MAG: M28 family peptidase [Solirubrobacterales bacterium]